MNKFDPEASRNAMNTCKVLGEVWAERQRQDEKWGQQNHGYFKWTTILAEEVGEAAKDALEGEYQKMRAELLQVAAVAVAAVECIDRENIEIAERCSALQP
jgi:NTP pyrophosphatase (non-canonical NTP hydrolase)